jgi:hypothetical protein
MHLRLRSGHNSVGGIRCTIKTGRARFGAGGSGSVLKAAGKHRLMLRLLDSLVSSGRK